MVAATTTGRTTAGPTAQACGEALSSWIGAMCATAPTRAWTVVAYQMVQTMRIAVVAATTTGRTTASLTARACGEDRWLLTNVECATGTTPVYDRVSPSNSRGHLKQERGAGISGVHVGTMRERPWPRTPREIGPAHAHTTTPATRTSAAPQSTRVPQAAPSAVQTRRARTAVRGSTSARAGSDTGTGRTVVWAGGDAKDRGSCAGRVPSRRVQGRRGKTACASARPVTGLSGGRRRAAL